MWRTFNRGVGMIAVVAADQVDDALACLGARDVDAWMMGSVRRHAFGGAGRERGVRWWMRDTGALAPLDDALTELERGRRDRWIVGIVLALAAVAALSLQTLDAAEEIDPWIILALVGLVAIHALTVVLQERRARRAIVSLIAEQQASASLEARAQTLEHVQDAVRDVIAASTLPEVFERLLAGAMRFSGATAGTVLLRVGDTLTVAASDGDDALPRGHRLPRGEGVAWSAVHAGEPVLIGRRSVSLDDEEPSASVLAAPLRLPGRTVGALVVERAAERAAFGDPELAAIRLFAEQAALAVRNASRLDAERAPSPSSRRPPRPGRRWPPGSCTTSRGRCRRCPASCSSPRSAPRRCPQAPATSCSPRRSPRSTGSAASPTGSCG
jgi:hypothetical protein